MRMVKSCLLKLLCLLCVLLFFITGCADSGNTAASDSVSLSAPDEKVPVALWESMGAESYSMSRLMEDTLYYMDAKWDAEESRLTEACFYRKLRGADEAEMITELGEAEPVIYFPDEGKAVYCLYGKYDQGAAAYYLRKISADGEEVFDVPFPSADQAGDESAQRIGSIAMGEADREGNIYLSSPYGEIYLLDKEGRLTTVIDAPWTEDTYKGAGNGLVNAGEDGIFAYDIENRNVTLQKVDFTQGKLEDAIEVQIDGKDNGYQENTLSIEIFNGYGMGVLIADSDTLWSYSISAEELDRLLGWGDSNINLKDYFKDAIGILPDRTLYVMVHKSPDDKAFVAIDYRSAMELPEKQTVTLGIMEGINFEYINSELDLLVSVFNRTSADYQIDYKGYAAATDLHTALLKGDGPDIIVLGNGLADINVLYRKGVLENLSGYFAKSDAVREDDLLPSIRDAGTIDKELVCVFPSFMISGLLVEKGTTEEGEWTAEEFVALGEAHPDAAMGDYGDPAYYRNSVFINSIQADMDSYIDWEQKQCYFDSEKFISLLRRVKELQAPKTSDMAELSTMNLDAVMEKFLAGDNLTHSFTCSSIGGFQRNLDLGGYGGDYAEMAGYPNGSGMPRYVIECRTALGLNSASQNKEGAWAFMEFLLSDSYQSTTEEFPTRIDTFEKHLKLKEMYGGYVKIELSAEQRAFIKYMADHAYWVEASTASSILPIISEEIQAVWTGDKMEDEAAKIIQSRISLYLSEQLG